jgi:hypothetical protein
MRDFVWLGLGGPLALSVGNKLHRVPCRWRANSFASGFCAHITHDLRVHRKTRSRIMVGFARDEISWQRVEAAQS